MNRGGEIQSETVGSFKVQTWPIQSEKRHKSERKKRLSLKCETAAQSSAKQLGNLKRSDGVMAED